VVRSRTSFAVDPNPAGVPRRSSGAIKSRPPSTYRTRPASDQSYRFARIERQFEAVQDGLPTDVCKRDSVDVQVSAACKQVALRCRRSVISAGVSRNREDPLRRMALGALFEHHQQTEGCRKPAAAGSRMYCVKKRDDRTDRDRPSVCQVARRRGSSSACPSRGRFSSMGAHSRGGMVGVLPSACPFAHAFRGQPNSCLTLAALRLRMT